MIVHYKSFRIKNFKGVRDTAVSISGADTRAMTLIGLNESGKTTLLEAIYSFSPDIESQPLFENDSLVADETARIPRDRLFSFTDTISVTAVLTISETEKTDIAKQIAAVVGGSCKIDDIPTEISVTDWTSYVNSKFDKKGLSFRPGYPKVKSGQQKNWRSPGPIEQSKIWQVFKSRFPAIAYFPFFLSDVPARIYLRGFEDDKANSFYRRIFQDILYQVGPTTSIKNHILDRIEDDNDGIVSKTISAFWGSPRRGMVQQLIDKASLILSKTITDRWNDIFKDHIGNEATNSRREIVINFGLEEVADEVKPIPYVEFAIKDGANRYNIADRSLGFRWFFCFLLFTQFRARRQSSLGTLFLFDEPASNLHAKAQEKLLDSFSDVCRAPNSLIYSTHSPYMIKPIWLDQAYVIENSLITSELSEIGTMAVSESSNIIAAPYRSYVDVHPNRLHHFQPVMDRLEVKPSLLDIDERTLLVEGKSDYAILFRLIGDRNLPFKVIPAHGATTLGPLIGLLRGWSWRFAVLFDSDPAGKGAATKFKEEFILSREIITISDCAPNLSEIEDLLSTKDRALISETLSITGKLTKKQIYQFFISSYPDGTKLDAATSEGLEGIVKFVSDQLDNKV